MDDGAKHDVPIGCDASAREPAEPERGVVRERLLRAQATAAVGRLTGGIAHDFNNQLTAMLGYASFLAADLPDGSPEQQFAHQIQKAGEQTKQLVQQLLSLSRCDRDVEDGVDVTGVAERTASLLRSALPKTITLVTEFRGPAAVSVGSAGELTQLMLNLCDNAKDAIGDRPGTVRLALDVVAAGGIHADGPPAGRAGRACIGALRAAGKYVRIVVDDDGCGMPRATLERIFEPFFTTKAIGAGTGLGLPAVQRIVTLLGGALRVESRPGSGTRFEVFLPLAAERAAPDRPAATVDARPGLTALVVDGDEPIATMMAIMLERMGCEAAACTSPADALAAVAETPSLWHVVVAGHAMPGMTGLELARRIWSLRADLPVILCSGPGEDLPPRGAATGPIVRVRKPLTSADLAKALTDASDLASVAVR